MLTLISNKVLFSWDASNCDVLPIKYCINFLRNIASNLKRGDWDNKTCKAQTRILTRRAIICIRVLLFLIPDPSYNSLYM